MDAQSIIAARRLALAEPHRILSPFEVILPDLTKRDEPIFTEQAPSKSCFVRLHLATECRHLSVILYAGACAQKKVTVVTGRIHCKAKELR